MNYTQGFPSPNFSPACFFNCKTGGLEAITTKIPHKVYGFIFTVISLFFLMDCIYFNKTGLCSFAKMPWTSWPSCFFAHEILQPKFLFLFTKCHFPKPSSEATSSTSSDLPSQTGLLLLLEFSNMGSVLPKPGLPRHCCSSELPTGVVLLIFYLFPVLPCCLESSLLLFPVCSNHWPRHFQSKNKATTSVSVLETIFFTF